MPNKTKYIAFIICCIMGLGLSSPLYAAYDHKEFIKAKKAYDKFLKYQQANPDKYSMNEWKKLGHPYMDVLQQTYYLDKDATYTGSKRLKKGQLAAAENPVQYQYPNANHHQKLVAAPRATENQAINHNPGTIKTKRTSQGPSFQSIANKHGSLERRIENTTRKIRVQKLLANISK